MALNILRQISRTGLTKNIAIRMSSTDNDAIVKEEPLRYYRTAENNPLKHDERHFGRLYSVSYWWPFRLDCFCMFLILPFLT